ncbi:hypothetical protein L1887_05592 [Cichorium endivia]|nr:hypothetical protein L1887_05592 [Cichorium endivia]
MGVLVIDMDLMSMSNRNDINAVMWYMKTSSRIEWTIRIPFSSMLWTAGQGEETEAVAVIFSTDKKTPEGGREGECTAGLRFLVLKPFPLSTNI